MAETLEELIEKAKPFLREYLEKKGVQIIKKGSRDFFRCINPEHPDNNPSCGFVKGTDETVFHCFACGCSGTVVHARHYLDGLPLYGMEFVTENLVPLLKEKSVSYEELKFDDSQVQEYRYLSVYRAAYQALVALDDTGTYKHLDQTHAKNRGWNNEICQRIGIGTVRDFDQYLADVAIRAHVTPDDAQAMGIVPQLFGPDLLTFTIRDHKARPLGFVARYVPYTKGSTIPKYNNTASHRNPYYQKEKILFGLDVARNYAGLRVDIFEGYGSLVTAQQAGYKNCVAMGGTALTEAHVELLHSLGFTHLNLVMDQDDIGPRLMQKYLDKFSGFKGLKVTLTTLPLTDEDKKIDGANDPDYFIQKYGLQKYREIKPIGAFEFLVQDKVKSLQKDSPEAVEFCKSMTKLILNEVDLIERGQMISALSDNTGVPKDDIRDEIARLESKDVTVLADKLSKQLRNCRDADSFSSMLNQAQSALSDTGTTKQDRYLISVSESLQNLEDIFKSLEERSAGIHGWTTGYKEIDDLLDGIPKPALGGRAIGFAGAPQHAKSAVLLNVSLNVARFNQGVSVCYWAIDDNRKAVAERLLSMVSGVEIRKVQRRADMDADEETRVEEARDELRQLVSDKKLIFKDDTFGRSKEKAELWFRHMQDQTSNELLVCVDSLHNVAPSVAGTDERIRMKEASNWVKKMATSLPATFLATLELVKNRDPHKPTLTSISETGKIEFDFDVVAICWNEAQGLYAPIETVRAKWGEPGKYHPIIELDFQKNKVNGERGSVFLYYDSTTLKFVKASRTLPREFVTEEQTSSSGVTYRTSA